MIPGAIPGEGEGQVRVLNCISPWICTVSDLYLIVRQLPDLDCQGIDRHSQPSLAFLSLNHHLGTDYTHRLLLGLYLLEQLLLILYDSS